MNKKSTMLGIAATVIIIVLGVAIVVLMNRKVDTPPSSTKTATTPAPSSTSHALNVAAVITYSDSGFSPATTTVKAGETVEITNTSNSDMQLDSDPHPAHTDDADLNLGTIPTGVTKSFIVVKKGSFGFHNNLMPSRTGKIVIE